jgi:hypothetical protein
MDAAQVQEVEDNVVEAEAEAEKGGSNSETRLRGGSQKKREGGGMRWQGEHGDAETCGGAKRQAVATEATKTVVEGE